MALGLTLDFLANYLTSTDSLRAGSPSPLIVAVSGLVPKPGIYQTLAPVDDKIVVSLINIEEERNNKQPYKYITDNTKTPAVITKVNPDINLNLYVMFTAYYDNYYSSLTNLSKVIGYFAEKNVFTKDDILSNLVNVIDFPMEQVTIEMYSQTLEQVNNIWQAMGGNIYPSVMYKLRLIAFRPTTEVSHSQEILSVEITS